MEREEGKLTSQERFWQARLLSKEAEYRTQLTAIHQQLEALKDTTNHAKADLENHSKDESMMPTPLMKDIPHHPVPQTKDLEGTLNNDVDASLHEVMF